MKILKDLLGLCNHKWKFIKEIKRKKRERIMHVLECENCGIRTSIRVW